MPSKGVIMVVAAGAAFLAMSAGAQAAGFGFSELSAVGLASGGAVVSDPFEVGAIPYNPALMAYHPGTHLIAGVVAIDRYSEVLPASGGALTSVSMRPRYLPQGDYFTTRGHWSAGLGIDTPYAFETSWPLNTFSGAGVAQPLTSKIVVYDLHPMLGYHAGGFAIAAQLDYEYVRELLLTSPGVQTNGSGEQPGWSLGIAERLRSWTIGAHYRSATQVSVDGSMNGLPASIPLALPWSFQAGINHAFSRRWSLETDFERTGWDRLQALNVTGPGGGTLVADTLDWTATDTYRIAGRYRLPGGVTMHFGFAVEQNPEPLARFSGRLPAAEAHLFSVGASQHLGPWALDAGLAYLQLAQRTVVSAVAPGTYGADLNGTSAFNGRYRSHAILLGVDITRRF
ncbi:MAG: OmpP1/FadL family transporter [Acidiferrobacteraceae bacterium]